MIFTQAVSGYFSIMFLASVSLLLSTFSFISLIMLFISLLKSYPCIAFTLVGIIIMFWFSIFRLSAKKLIEFQSRFINFTFSEGL